MARRFLLAALLRLRERSDGVSAIEFAIVFPVMMMLMLGGTQLVTYINAVRKVEATASSISEMLSQKYDPSNPATVYVTADDLHFARDQTMVIFPYVMKDAASRGIPWPQDVEVDFASVQFVPNAQSCPGYDQSKCYVANVVWTTNNPTGTGNGRPCGVQSASTSSYTNSGSLPSNVFGPGSLIAVDVVFTFKPSFGNTQFLGMSLFGTQRIARSVYVQPRYASLIDFNILGNDGIATECPSIKLP